MLPRLLILHLLLLLRLLLLRLRLLRLLQLYLLLLIHLLLLRPSTTDTSSMTTSTTKPTMCVRDVFVILTYNNFVPAKPFSYYSDNNLVTTPLITSFQLLPIFRQQH